MREVVKQHQPRLDFPDDCARIVRVLAARGFSLTPAMAAEAWEAYSETLCAGWMTLDDSDDTLVPKVLSGLREAGYAEIDHKPQETRVNDRTHKIIALYEMMPGASSPPVEDGLTLWGEVDHTDEWAFCEILVDRFEALERRLDALEQRLSR